MKIFLDSNAILNATFISSSFSHIALALAKRNHSEFYIGESTLAEAKKVAQIKFKKLGKSSNPEHSIDHLIQILGARIVSAPSDKTPASEIPHHDVHVYLEASGSNSSILTSDNDLWLACKACNYPALLPIQIIRELQGHSLSSTIFGIQPSIGFGTIFIRAFPGGWGHVIDGKFTLIHYPGTVWIYYDAAKKMWFTELYGQDSLAINSPVVDNTLQTIALSWKNKTIEFRVNNCNGSREALRHTQMNGSFSQARIGSHAHGNHFWNGSIYCCISDDRPMGKENWKKLQRDKELMPNPYDQDRLDSFIQALPDFLAP